MKRQSSAKSGTAKWNERRQLANRLTDAGSTNEEAQSIIEWLQDDPDYQRDGVVRIYTKREVDERVADEKQRWLANIQAVNIIYDAFKHYENQIDMAYQSVFIATRADKWAELATSLHAEFLGIAASVNQDLETIRQNHPFSSEHPSEQAVGNRIEEICGAIKQVVMQMSSDLSRAMETSKAKGDCSALRRLGEQTSPLAVNLYADELRQLATDHIVAPPQADRGALYIGERAYRLDSQGITDTEQQWQAIYRELKAQQTTLKGDMLEAWQYFQKKKPREMPKDEYRYFRQEISRLRLEAKQRNERKTFRQLSDENDQERG